MALRVHSIINTALLWYWDALILVITPWIFILQLITTKWIFCMRSRYVTMIGLIAKEFRWGFGFRIWRGRIFLFLGWWWWSIVVSVIWAIFLQALNGWISSFAWWCWCGNLCLLHWRLMRVMIIFLMGV